MKVEVLDRGMFSLIVDSGRVGRQRDGFCESGPMDSQAYHWANFLAFNFISFHGISWKEFISFPFLVEK